MPTAPKPLESPLARRSALLAELLKQNQAPQRIEGGYGELAARLLAEGLTQRASEKTDTALAAEQSNADLARRQRIAAGVGGTIEGTPQEVGDGRLGNPFSGLVNMLRGKPEQPQTVPQATPPPVTPPVMPTNTQEPVVSPVAPIAPVQGQPRAPVPPPAATQPPPQQQAQQPPPPQQSPLAVTDQEKQLILQYLSSGDASLVAQAEKMVQDIQTRQAEPAQGRYEITNVNGVPYRVDPITGRSEAVFQGGLPTEVMNQNATVGPENPYGVAGGTGITLDPYNRPTIVGRPQEGYQSDGAGGVVPIRGGREDLGGNPTARFQGIQSVRAEVKPILDAATSLNRNIQAVRSGLRAQNGAGDIAVINGLQKLIDEGVVREGDVALQLRAQGINGGLAGLTGFLQSTGTFSPEIRAQLGSVAEDIYGNMTPLYREQVMGRRDLVERTFGPGSFDDVIAPTARQAFGWEDAPSPQRQTAPNQQRQPTRAELEAEARRRGLIQ